MGWATLVQLEEALRLGVDAVLLDNMGPETLHVAVAMVDGRAITTEASGRIRPETPHRPSPPAALDLLSVGWLTYTSATVLDVGLDHLG